MSRRAALVVLLGGVWVCLWAGAAAADDCSSPTDCANTAWTVGGGAAVAATIIAAAAAGGWLANGNGATSEDRTDVPPECRELAPLGERIDAEVRRLAALAGARRGALERAEAARAMAEHAAEEHRRALVRAHAAGRGGQVATAEGVLADAAGMQQAHLAEVGRRQAARMSRVLGQKVNPPPAGWGGHVLGGVSLVMNFWGHAASGRADDALRRAGRYEEIVVQRRAEVARWEAQASDWGRELSEGVERLRPDAERYRRTLLEHGCPAPALSVEDLFDLLRNPPRMDPTLGTATLPDSLLEQPEDVSAFQRQRREQADQPLGCEQYDAELAAYERDLGDQADEQRWQAELRRWATRRAQLEELWWVLQETRAVLDVLLGSELEERQGAAVGAAAATVGSMIPGIGWAGALAFGMTSIVLSVGGGSAVENAKLVAKGRLTAHEKRIRYRIGQAEAELGRLRSLHSQRRLRREDTYARLMKTWRRCSPGWQKAGATRPMPQQPPWASDIGSGWRQLADPVTPFPRLPAGTRIDTQAVQAAAAHIRATLQEVETWR